MDKGPPSRDSDPHNGEVFLTNLLAFQALVEFCEQFLSLFHVKSLVKTSLETGRPDDSFLVFLSPTKQVLSCTWINPPCSLFEASFCTPMIPIRLRESVVRTESMLWAGLSGARNPARTPKRPYRLWVSPSNLFNGCQGSSPAGRVVMTWSWLLTSASCRGWEWVGATSASTICFHGVDKGKCTRYLVFQSTTKSRAAPTRRKYSYYILASLYVLWR
jgi:hypothetical protein